MHNQPEMYGNDFFGRRGENNCQGEKSDQGGTSRHRNRNQNFSNQAQSPFKNANWNGLSLRNRGNQVHYQVARDPAPPPLSESDEWPDSDVKSHVTRKRLASPLPIDSAAKRARVQNESLPNQHHRQRQMLLPSARNTQQYSSTEFRLPHPIENNLRYSSWLGPDIPNGEKWGSAEGGGFGQLLSPKIPRKANGYGVLLDDHQHNNYTNLSGVNRAKMRREQSMMPDAFHDSPLRQRGQSMAPDSYRNSTYQPNCVQATPNSRSGYGRQQIVDLTSPESIHRRGTQASTNSGSSTMRRATETEPTDFENDCDPDVDDYKSSRMQSYTPIGGITNDGSKFSQSRNGAKSVILPSRNTYPSQLGQNFHDYHSNSLFYNTSVQRESYRVPTVPQFTPALKTEDSNGRSNPYRESPNQSVQNSNYHPAIVEDDPESDEHDTIEDSMRKSAWKKKAKAAQKASTRVVPSKRKSFGGNGRSASGYSSWEYETSKAREEAEESTLSRIRGPNTSTLPIIGDTIRYVTMNQTPGQKAAALKKEKAEQLRQRQAAETIIEREKQAKNLQEFDELFEEAPVDEAALARLQKCKEIEKIRKQVSEEAKIIDGGHKEIQEKLEAIRKQRVADKQRAYDAEKKRNAEQRRLQDKKIEEERLKAKRKLAAETVRLQRVMEEEARLEALNELEAEKQAAKRRAATLQSFKKPDNKPSLASEHTQGKESEKVEVSGNVSDDGLFVIDDDDVEAIDELPNKQPLEADKAATDKSTNIPKPEITAENDTLPSAQKPGIVGDNPDAQSSGAASIGQNPDGAADKEEILGTTIESAAEKSKAVDNATSNVKNKQVPAAMRSGTSILEVASDGRRRPQEIFKPRVARRVSPDPIRFTGGTRPVRGAVDSDKNTLSITSHTPKKVRNKNLDSEESRTEIKLRQTLKEIENIKKKALTEEARQKKEWDARFKKLGEMLTPQDREDVAAGNRRACLGRNQNLTALPITNNVKSISLTSQINFVSTLEAQENEKKRAEERRLAKYEKDKAVRRKRYDREIRIVLSGQGVEPDDEKISKQVDEKMAIWDENRRKKERREFGGKNIFASLNQQDDLTASDTEKDGTSPPTLHSTDNEGSKNPEAQKEQVRAQAVRAGVQFLAAQNKVGNDFATAASKFRIQDFESDESEEDPDDEPEVQVASTAQQMAEQPEEMADVDMSEALNPVGPDASIIPPLPQVPDQVTSKTAFLPDIVNPKEEDMMHSYTVKHRAARENNEYETLILGSFHSLEEANAFAQEKLSQFYLGPSTGKSETHTSDNLYLGRVITDKDKDHDEIVWVTRDIVYIGDTANIKRGDLKNIIVPKVFNVLQVMEDNEGRHVGTVMVTASIRTFANKKAADLYLELSKPSRPRIDSLAFYNEEVVPAVRKNLEQAEEQEAELEMEGVSPDTGRSFIICVSENPVVGPLN